MQNNCSGCQSQDNQDYSYENLENNTDSNFNGFNNPTKNQCNCKSCGRVKNFERKCCYKQRWVYTETRPSCGQWYEC